MNHKIDRQKLFTFSNAITVAKGVAVICAFLAFAISMRQIEFNRFSQIKPLFEITLSKNASQFGMLNHGGIVYFSGCGENGAGQFLNETPRRHSTLSNKLVDFKFSKPLKEGESLFLYYSDIDLNVYEVKITYKEGGFYIDGIPSAYRSTLFCSLSRKWLDSSVSILFPKDWYSKENTPELNNLVVKYTDL